MNTNTEEWGNIELPGLSDEKLLNTNWNKSRKGIVKYNESWRESQQSGAKKNAQENLEWIKKTLEKNKKIGKDPNRISKISKKANERMADPEFRSWHNEQNRIRNSKKVKTPLGIYNTVSDAANAMGISTNCLRRRINNKIEGYWMEEKNTKNKTTGKPIVTPLGIFSSKRYAAEAYLASGKVNAIRWIEKWLVIDNNNFYYISKEEYIMLTGKEI